VIEAQHVDEAPRDLSRRSARYFALGSRQGGLAGRGWTRNATHLQFYVVEETKIGAAFADRKVLGEVPVGAQSFDAQFRDAEKFVWVRTFAERQKDVRAGVI
jgi:hypothetical protein